MAVLSVGMFFLALSLAEEPTSENVQAEVRAAVLMPIETSDQAEHEELSDGCLDTEEFKEPEISQQVEVDTENQDGIDLNTPIFEELLILPECTPVIFINTELDESSKIEEEESIDESALNVYIQEDDPAIAGSESAEIGIETQESDAGFGATSAHEEMEPTQTPDEEILTTFLTEEDEVDFPSQVSYRSLSSDDFMSSFNIPQLVLENTTKGYKAVQDMALVLTITNWSDKAIRVKAVVRFEAGTAQLYEAMGFTVPEESKDIILGAGEEQSMTWLFYCGQDLSSGTVSAIPAETDLTFRLDFICEWEDMI